MHCSCCIDGVDCQAIGRCWSSCQAVSHSSVGPERVWRIIQLVPPEGKENMDWKLAFLVLILVTLSSVKYIGCDEKISLRCLVADSGCGPCSELEEVAVPDRLVKLYRNLSADIKLAFSSGNITDVKPENFLEIPYILLSLLPDHHFTNISGTAVAKLMKSGTGAANIGAKCLQFLTHEEQKQFFSKMANAIIPEVLESKIAAAMIMWRPLDEWSKEFFTQSVTIGSPILAYLPGDQILNISEKVVATFLVNLQEWKQPHLQIIWSNKTMFIKRLWAYTFVKHDFPKRLEKWTSHMLKLNGFMLEGATADEIVQLNLSSGESAGYLKDLRLSKLQARAVFEGMYKNFSQFEIFHFIEELNVVPLLTPRHLQRYKPGLVDFTTTLDHVTALRISLSTIKQMLEYHIVKLLLQRGGHFDWTLHILLIPEFVHILPESTLQEIKKPLPFQALIRIDSKKLSPGQARVLSSGVDIKDLLLLKGFLDGIPSYNISQIEIGEMEQSLLHHLLTNLPVTSRLRTFVIFQKVKPQLYNVEIFESILLNEEPNQFLEFLSPRDVMTHRTKIFEILYRLQHKDYKNSVKKLYEPILSEFLSWKRVKFLEKSKHWTLEALSSLDINFAILALKCYDVSMIEVLDVVQVLDLYNRERKSVDRPFPREMQYCWQNAVANYLVMKAKLRGCNNLFSHLEQSEIESIGGYIFAGFSPEILENINNLLHVIVEIGKLSPQEVLAAVNGTDLTPYTKLFTTKLMQGEDKISFKELIQLGSLVNFMDSSDIKRIMPRDFKLFLETRQPDYKLLCVSSMTRKAWFSLLNTSFGNPEEWNETTLGTVGDFMVVIPSNVLDKIPNATWTKVADVLSEETYYHTDVHVKGDEPAPFYKACLKFLKPQQHDGYTDSVKLLLKKYLIEVQNQLNTILQATEIMPNVNIQNAELRSVPGRIAHNIMSIDVHTAKGKKSRTAGYTLENDLLGPFHQINLRYKRENSDRIMFPGANLRVAVKKNLSVENLTAEEFEQFLENSTEITDVLQISVPPTNNSVSCDAIKMLGKAAAIALSESDIQEMDTKEVTDCIETFGNLDLEPQVRKSIWNKIGKVIKENMTAHFLDLGHLVQDMTFDSVLELDLNMQSTWTLDVLHLLGREVEDPSMLKALGERWLAGNPEYDLTVEALAAMGDLICRFSFPVLRDYLTKSSTFVQLSPFLGRIKGCPVTCLRDLARIAVMVEAYGNPGIWTPEVVTSLGVVIAGLDVGYWKHFSSNIGSPLSGIQMTTAKCIPNDVLTSLSPEQLAAFSPSVMAAFSEDQLRGFSEEQMKEVSALKMQQPRIDLVKLTSSSTSMSVEFLIGIFMLFVYFSV